MNENKVTMVWYCKHGKFRITEDEERQLFSQKRDARHPMLRLQEIRKEKKREEICLPDKEQVLRQSSLF